MRWTSRVALAMLLSLVASAAPAQAAEPLRAYTLTVKPSSLQKLAKAGFDVTEGVQGNQITVAASRRQLTTLKKLGLKPQLQRSGARVAPDYGPSGGYDVWRPYARPAYDLGGAPVPNLIDEMKQLAADNPGIVKLEKIGMSTGGVPDNDPSTDDANYTDPKPIYAVKVSHDAKSEPDGSKPAVLYSSTQHAREWLSTETNRRLMKLFIENYGQSGTAQDVNGDPIPGLTSDELTDLVNTRELWFVLVCNPDGYDYTFESPGTRLWRKNLRDNNGDGVFGAVDGVDPNRNFATHWGLDDEGSSSSPASETYRGAAPQSESETQALDGLMKRVNFEFNNNYHTFGPLLLYPFGWQVNTYAADDPLFRAIAGSDENPAIPGFNPGVGAELYITNGDTNDHAYTQYDTLSFTPELNGGDENAEAGAGGFIFQDVEADVEEQFELQVQFALDMARSADDPANLESHLGNTAPNFQVDTFDVSYGDPQTVQVSAKRELGDITLHWQIGGGEEQTAPTTEWKGGKRYGDEGDVYYHRVRGDVTGVSPGDNVKVWFTAEGAKSKAFTYTLASDSGAPVLILSAENYSGGSPAYADPSKPAYLSAYTDSLDALGVDFDVWDVDARGLKAPDPLGVLSHYAAIVWYTGDDFITRYPGQGPGTGAAKVANDLTIAVRDRLNEGGKVLLTGSESGEQYFGAFEYSQFGEPVASTDNGFCDPDPDIVEGCIPLSDDFFQYWLGGYVYVAGGGSDGTNAFPVEGVGPFDGIDFGFDPAGNQAGAGTALVTSSVLDPARFPWFASVGLAEYVRPGAAPYDPFTGDWYVYTGMADLAYRRLTKTVDLTGKTGGALDFQVSYDTEPDYDFGFVE
ncbi:MAG: hypothetical protein QOI80_1511, partial [Solirubrobacteraceae bacterium]|nr:hypothetical protein [Solirubrobacteraceae bacterium]